jgi:hypothetical protein
VPRGRRSLPLARSTPRLTPRRNRQQERTIDQDPAFAIRVLVDIAIKALSPAVNDPTTAVQVSNYLEQRLQVAAAADLSYRYGLVDATGTLRWTWRWTGRTRTRPVARLPESRTGRGSVGAGARAGDSGTGTHRVHGRPGHADPGARSGRHRVGHVPVDQVGGRARSTTRARPPPVSTDACRLAADRRAPARPPGGAQHRAGAQGESDREAGAGRPRGNELSPGRPRSVDGGQ